MPWWAHYRWVSRVAAAHAFVACCSKHSFMSDQRIISPLAFRSLKKKRLFAGLQDFVVL
jgi:hypothetical protein